MTTNRHLRRCLLCLALLWGAPPAAGADKAGNYAVWGKGGKSCHAYNQSRAAKTDRDFREYAMGYITAYNTLADDTYNIIGDMTLLDMLAWLDDYCAEKPIHGFEQAMAGLLLERHESRHRVPPGARRR